MKMMGYPNSKEPKAEPVCLYDDLRNLNLTRSEFKMGWAYGSSVTALGAGVDTMTWTINTTLTSIGLDSHVQSLVHSEIDAAIKSGAIPSSGPVDYEASVNALPYLQACLKEAMRLYPNIGIPLERIVPHAVGSISFDGYNIPVGTTVGTNSWVQARNKSVFGSDAESFRPERWTEAAKEEKYLMSTCDLSFGTAARSCPGKHLAWVVMSKFLATVLRDFEIKVCNELNGKPGPGGQVWKMETTFPTKSVGVDVVFVARS